MYDMRVKHLQKLVGAGQRVDALVAPLFIDIITALLRQQIRVSKQGASVRLTANFSGVFFELSPEYVHKEF